MAQQYGTVKVDFITFTSGTTGNETDVTIPVSGLSQLAGGGDVVLGGNLTVSGDVIIGNDLTVSGDINASGVTISGITGLFASGTEAAPSISFIDDTDTGFYNAAANEVRITTSGNDRLTVTTSGNVGIGKTSPDTLLHLNQADPTDGILLKLNNDLNASGTEAGVRIRQFDTEQLECNLLTERRGFNAGVDFKIELSDSAGAVTERFRIDEDGNVGIGTTDPIYKLDVVGQIQAQASSQPKFLLQENTVNQSYSVRIGGSSEFFLRNETTANDAITLLTDGKVGIGTSTPTARLTVSNNQGGSTGRVLIDANVTSGYDTRIDATDNGLEFSAQSNNRDFVFNTGSTLAEKARITTNGDIIATRTSVAKNFKETVFSITWSAGFALNPLNGETQFVVLGGNSTPTQSSWDNGESITLHIDDGSSRTIDWTTLGVVWTGGSAPTLATTGDTVVQFWKAANVIYGALVGEVA